jgi:cytochrome o ubiquinol oxidase operon protein cyoD
MSVSNPSHAHEPTLAGYLTGFGLALILTLIPFGLVAWDGLAIATTLVVVAICAVLQVLVHLIFFLHLDMSEEQRWNTISIAFSAVIMFVLVGGTIWLFYSLKFRMMVGY